MNAVILLSGGLDSATTMAIARDQGFNLYALSFSYGQRHSPELKAAKKVADAFNVKEHIIQEIDLRAWGGSALTDNIEVPQTGTSDTIPVTYVPARNTIFLSFGLAYAEAIKANHIFIGVNAVDYSGYPDCRPEYITAFQQMADLATKAGIEKNGPKIETPLIDLKKSEIIKEGVRLGVDFGNTLSCYAPTIEGMACGKCDSCSIRKKGFKEAGISDPTIYMQT